MRGVSTDARHVHAAHGARASASPAGPLSWPAVVGGGILCGVFGGAALAATAAAALALWLLARAIPRGALVVPGAVACWFALLVLILR
jgi:hypothetical protein